jgi:two-component system chemotaxis sensor kinase CheA
MDMSPYRNLFISEANSHLAAFSELIVLLEDSPGDTAAIGELFRHAHSMKGMAATMGYEQIVAIAHRMEDHLGKIRSGEFPLRPALADLLLEGGDVLGRLVSRIDAGSDEFEDTAGLVQRLTEFDPASEVQTGSYNLPDRETADTPQEAAVAQTHQSRQTDSLKSIRIKTETLDHLVNITGELLTNRYRLAESIRQADAAECREPLNQLTLLLRTLRDEVFKARMLPFSVIAERFPRLIRDLARKQGKEVRFLLEGRDIELDRGILEEIAEPIVHILRNAVDHGLESADERVMAGKPFGGTITLTVRRDKDHVEIIIADDGGGMDAERLKKKAVEKGLVSAEKAAQISQQETYQLICAPGFSTAPVVTEISGRGVGMDAVREAVHGLSGVLTIYSERGQGSRFVMRLPITISIIHALIVQSGSFEVAFPINVVTRTVELQSSDIIEEPGGAAVMLDEISFPLRDLRHVLNIPVIAGLENTHHIPAVVCDIGSAQVALSVDRIIGQQEIFVRPLRSPLSHLRGVSGATIAGDGRVLFVVDVNALF